MKLYFCLWMVLLFNNANAQDTLLLKRYVSNLKMLEVTIKDSTYNFLFDTGGAETFISPDIASRVGKAVYGNVTGFRMSGETIKYQKCDSIWLKIGNEMILHSTVGVWDIMSILPKELPRLDGVLSLKSFQNKLVTLDLANNRLIVESPASYERQIATKKLLPSRFANGLDGNDLNIFVGIPRRDRFYWFLFDCGNLNDLLLSHTTAVEWGLQSDTVSQRNTLGVVPIVIGRATTEAEASSDAIIYDGALNYAVMSRYVFTINFPKKEVWVE